MTCFIFRELAYWTYKMCSRNRFLVKDKMVTWVAVMWSSIPLWCNVLVVEHLFSYYVLKTDLMEMLPLKSRYDPLSLIITFLLVSPLFWFNYACYLRSAKLAVLEQKYKAMGRMRRIAGQCACIAYVIASVWLMVYVSDAFYMGEKKKVDQNQYMERLEKIREDQQNRIK